MHRMMQLTYGMVAFERRGAAVRLLTAGMLAAGLSGIAAPARAQTTVPGAPVGLSALPGDRNVSLHWKEVDDDGGAAVTGFQYRAKVSTGTYPNTWTTVPEFTGTVGATLELFIVLTALSDGTALSNGTEYAFQVRAVNSEGGGTPAEAMATPQVNVPAVFTVAGESGVITRVPRVPADVYVTMVGAVDDVDGTDAADTEDDRFTYRWQWIRVKGGTETEIRGATAGTGSKASSYTLIPADVGSQIKARLRFRDDRSNQEEFVSTLFPSSGTILPAAACVPPTYTGGATQIWSEEIGLHSLDEPENRYGRRGNRLDDDTFSAGANSYEIDFIYRATSGSDAGLLIFGLESDLTETDKAQLTLHVCDQAYPLVSADHHQVFHDYMWSSSADWSTMVTRTIYLSRDTVAPTVTRATISGASLVITFSEDLDGGSAPATSAFTLESGGSAVELEAGNAVALDGRTVILTLAESPPANSTITVDYARAGTDALRDKARNEVEDFRATTTRPTPPPPPPPPPNDPPEFLSTPYVFELPERLDGTSVPVVLGTVEARDPEDGSVTYELTSGDTRLFAVGSSTGAVTYIGPGEDLDSGPGQYALQVQATDSDGESATATVEIRVTHVNRGAPQAVDDAAETPEDTPVTIAVLANDSDPDGDALTVKEVSAPAHGTAVISDAGTVTYTPEPDFSGSDSFTYTVGDGSGLTAQAAVKVTVLAVNEEPLAVDDAAETLEDTPVTVAVLTNDSDPDGDELTVAEISVPAHGTARLTETGAVEYTPEPDYHGSDGFTYVVGDGTGLTAEAAVEVTVLPVNDAPQAVGVIPDQTLEAGDGPSSLDLGPYFDDRDGDRLGYTAVASEPAVALGLTGATLALTVARPGAATVTVTAQDSGGLTATQAFMVTTTDRQARGVVEHTLAALGRGHLASARGDAGAARGGDGPGAVARQRGGAARAAGDERHGGCRSGGGGALVDGSGGRDAAAVRRLVRAGRGAGGVRGNWRNWCVGLAGRGARHRRRRAVRGGRPGATGRRRLAHYLQLVAAGRRRADRLSAGAGQRSSWRGRGAGTALDGMGPVGSAGVRRRAVAGGALWRRLADGLRGRRRAARRALARGRRGVTQQRERRLELRFVDGPADDQPDLGAAVSALVGRRHHGLGHGWRRQRPGRERADVVRPAGGERPRAAAGPGGGTAAAGDGRQRGGAAVARRRVVGAAGDRRGQGADRRARGQRASAPAWHRREPPGAHRRRDACGAVRRSPCAARRRVGADWRRPGSGRWLAGGARHVPCRGHGPAVGAARGGRLPRTRRRRDAERG